jgi:hypothetical protein
MVGNAVVRLASGSTEPASMSAWGLLLIAIGLLLRAMRFRATSSSKAEASPRAPGRTLEAAVGIALTKYLRTGRSSISP